MIARILVVEDEALVADFVAEILSDRGHKVVGIVDNGADAIALAQEHHPDLILMDIEIKGPIDGIQTAAQIQRHIASPILFLTAYKDDETLLMAVEQKPCGYLIKPVTEAELIAAVTVALKNNTPSTPKTNGSKYPYRYCDESGLLYHGEELIALSRLERRLAGLLFAQPGHLVSQEAILRACWPEQSVTDGSIRNLIFKMRRKLPLVRIEAIKELGYRLCPIA